MKRISYWFVIAAGLLVLPAPRSRAESPAPADAPVAVSETRADYVRMAEDEKSIRLETAVTTFTLPDGRSVDLFGVIHLGDAGYYKDVNRRLSEYDAVLFELIGDPEVLTKPQEPVPSLPAPRPHPLRSVQLGIGNALKLQFQLDRIDYTRPNFVHADASAEEFAAMQEARGESMMKLMLKSFELSSDPELSGKFREAESIGLGDLIMLFYSDKTMQRIKVIFARLLAESEQILESKILDTNNAIIAGRNDVALAKLTEVLTDPSKKRLAIFYGAGHMPSMETSLKEQFQAARRVEAWLPAWTMPAARKPKTESNSP